MENYNHMLEVGGKSFRCSCGANVFHKGPKKGLWICNGCHQEYADETYEESEQEDRIIKLIYALKELKIYSEEKDKKNIDDIINRLKKLLVEGNKE